MNWLMMNLPIFTFTLFAFAFGLVAGSFINVLVARLPFEKSVVWPGSRCMACLQPIALRDNLPIIGWLRLRGRCRTCGARFSSRYLWIELFTGLAFVALFLAEIVFNVLGSPGLRNAVWGGVPTLDAWIVFFTHALLIALLIAASAIDLQYKIVPIQLTVAGTLIGLILSTLFPWPFPNLPSDVPVSPIASSWSHPVFAGMIPTGMAMWPAWGPPLAWAPAGSWQLGLLTGLAGAAVGQFVGRSVKYLFETGFRREALGIGDADLMMMAGAFLGWQPVAIAFFVGAIVLLPIVLLQRLVSAILRRPPDADPAIPFGPGIAAGIVICWFGWSGWAPLGELVQTIFFEEVILAALVVIMGGGLLAAGTVISLVRGGEGEQPA